MYHVCGNKIIVIVVLDHVIIALNCIYLMSSCRCSVSTRTASFNPNSASKETTFTNAFFLNENVWILIQILLKFVRKGPINNIPALVQIMAWRRPGNKPLSEPMIVSLPLHLSVTQPKWVNSVASNKFRGNFRCAIFKLISVIDGRGISCEIAVSWLSLDHTDEKSTLVRVMAWCCQATSHYLNQCTWTSVDQDRWWHMASLGHNDIPSPNAKMMVVLKRITLRKATKFFKNFPQIYFYQNTWFFRAFQKNLRNWGLFQYSTFPSNRDP